MAIYWRNGWAWGRKKIKGREYRAPLETRNKREAESAYARWVTELERSSATGASRKAQATFRDAVNIFTEEHMPTLEATSQRRYLHSLMHLADAFDGKALAEIGKAELSGFVSARRKTGVTEATIIRDLSCLSSIFTIASDYELCDINPVQPFLRVSRKRKTLKNSDHRTRYLDHAEELTLLNYAVSQATAPNAIRRDEKLMIACAFCLYVDTGLRAQELLRMQWGWVNLDRLEITIPKEVTKGDKERVVPIRPRAEAILRRLPRSPQTDVVLWRGGGKSRTGGKRFKDLNHTLRRYAKACGIADLHIHDLRRTCGCRLLQDQGASMEQVSRWLGHSSVVMTESAYAFLRIENLHEIAGTNRTGTDLRPQLAVALEGAHEHVQTLIEPKRGTNGGTNSSYPDLAPAKPLKRRLIPDGVR